MGINGIRVELAGLGLFGLLTVGVVQAAGAGSAQAAPAAEGHWQHRWREPLPPTPVVLPTPRIIRQITLPPIQTGCTPPACRP